MAGGEGWAPSRPLAASTAWRCSPRLRKAGVARRRWGRGRGPGDHPIAVAGEGAHLLPLAISHSVIVPSSLPEASSWPLACKGDATLRTPTETKKPTTGERNVQALKESGTVWEAVPVWARALVAAGARVSAARAPKPPPTRWSPPAGRCKSPAPVGPSLPGSDFAQQPRYQVEIGPAPDQHHLFDVALTHLHHMQSLQHHFLEPLRGSFGLPLEGGPIQGDLSLEGREVPPGLGMEM